MNYKDLTYAMDLKSVRFEVFTAVTMKNGVFWVSFFAAYVGC
jgi:hypothetical protein